MEVLAGESHSSIIIPDVGIRRILNELPNDMRGVGYSENASGQASEFRALMTRVSRCVSVGTCSQYYLLFMLSYAGQAIGWPAALVWRSSDRAVVVSGIFILISCHPAGQIIM